MKQFVKALPKDGACFMQLCDKFNHLSDAKIKEGIFVGPDIRKLMHSLAAENTWKSFKEVVKHFLRNRKSPDYENILNDVLNNFLKLGCNMSIKSALSALSAFMLSSFLRILVPQVKNKMSFSTKIYMVMESRYQRRWNANQMADYCQMLKRDEPDRNHNKKIWKRSFEGCRVKYYKSF